jgi:hypothetical protein
MCITQPTVTTTHVYCCAACLSVMQVGTSYLVRDLYKAPEILRSPEDMQARFVEVELNEELAEKVGRKDPLRRRRG